MSITIQITINSSLDKVWQFWNEPEHIKQWLFASDDWECPAAENDLQEGGEFKYRMQAKGGSEGFDMAGVYTKVIPQQEIAYQFGDRHAGIVFTEENGQVIVTETFDPETVNSEEIQRAGWQAILDNFKKHVEANS